MAPQNWARLVEAKILATEGRYEEAEQLATAAVELTMQSDDQLDQANALVALATVVARAGRSDEARSLLEDAVSKFDKKGNVVAVTKTRDLAAELLGSPL